VQDEACTQTYPVEVASSPAECGEVRAALVLVKSWQTQRAAQQLAECLGADGLALTLQNGLGNREILAQALGDERVALGVTTVGANLLGPGKIRPAGEGTIHLQEHSRLEGLAGALRRAGFAVETAQDPESLLWGKLVINAGINPLTALLKVPNGALLDRPETRLLLAALVQETAAVARAQGVRLSYPDPVAAVEAVARRTASNRSSMLQDIFRGAPTEIDAICGAVVRAGEAVGIPTPVNWTMWKLVLARVNSQQVSATGDQVRPFPDRQSPVAGLHSNLQS
jgi:2-dehydropantoate 2-reductase